MQLGARDAIANVAVKNLDAAKKFYQDTLGLKQVRADGEAITFKSGNVSLIVYRSQFAGTNQATAVTWDVGDSIAHVVKELNNKGIRFEHYQMPDLKLEGDLHVGKTMKAAWFKDPDGNILGLMGR